MPEDKQTLGVGWTVLFKLNMVILPLVIIWAAWATASIYELKGFANTGPRFTPEMNATADFRLKEWTRQNFPSLDLRTDLKEIKKDIQEIKLSLAKSHLFDGEN